MPILTHRRIATLLLFPLAASASRAQSNCAAGLFRVHGQVTDTTSAAIVDALVSLGPAPAMHTDREGRFASACLHAGTYTVQATAPGFNTEKRKLNLGSDLAAFVLRLAPQTVETTINAATEETGASSEDVAGSKTLDKSDVAQLADDPDEFRRQLQVLAAAAGGAPGQATITVDGFQNSGRIPPKSAIAYIRVNPDLFSAEYAIPPYRGGRVEIYTKPGQAAFHGALFTTQSAGFVNARDPFSPSRAAIGKQRYGFELSGPIVRKRSDFALSLEHREIDQFAVVNAVTVNTAGAQSSIVANVATPQSLWQGSLAINQQLTPRNSLKTTYTAAVNGLTNQGVGGTVLAEAGYGSVQSEHTVQITDLATVSASLVHEARLGYTWRYRADSPSSTAPSLQVAGAFTGGGAVTGNLNVHERDLEFDDDVLYTHGRHSYKAGLQLLDTTLDETIPANFNGTYIFGGTATISGLQQYSQALRSPQTATATQFNIGTGTPQVALNQMQAVLYAQDQWKFRPRLELTYGLRWAMQNAPATVGNVAPRVGISWSPDRKQKTVLHARSGLFFGVVSPQTTLAALQLDGTVQRQLQINSPTYAQPLTSGASTVTTLRAPLPGLTQTPSLQSHLGVEHDFPRHWHAQANLYLVHAWDVLRSRNINTPLDGTASGPRPLAPALNLYQFQQTGRLGGNVLFLGLDQHSLKKLQIFAGYVRMDLRGNADTDTFFPQSSTSDSGETARPSWEATHQVIGFANYILPRAVNLSVQFNAGSGQPYNVTTGFDNNGDGVFNDRPVYATSSATKQYATRFGSLSPTGTGTVLGRNAGTLPWNVHLDANLSRSFALPHHANKEAQTLALNLRSTNLLNHTNVTAVGGVLGSPLFGHAYQADPGRRLEAGLRWSF